MGRGLRGAEPGGSWGGTACSASASVRRLARGLNQVTGQRQGGAESSRPLTSLATPRRRGAEEDEDSSGDAGGRDSPPSRGRGALITVTGYRMASSWSPLLGRRGGGVDQRAEHRSRSRQSERPMNRGVRETQGRGKGPTHRALPPRHRGRGPSPRFPSSSQRRAGALPAPRPERRPDQGPQNSRA